MPRLIGEATAPAARDVVARRRALSTIMARDRGKKAGAVERRERTAVKKEQEASSQQACFEVLRRSGPPSSAPPLSYSSALDSCPSHGPCVRPGRAGSSFRRGPKRRLRTACSAPDFIHPERSCLDSRRRRQEVEPADRGQRQTFRCQGAQVRPGRSRARTGQGGGARGAYPGSPACRLAPQSPGVTK